MNLEREVKFLREENKFLKETIKALEKRVEELEGIVKFGLKLMLLILILKLDSRIPSNKIISILAKYHPEAKYVHKRKQ